MYTQNKKGLSVFELVIFATFGSLMYCSKIIMQSLPNIHLIGMFIITFTVVFRKKALIPIYIYVLLDGIFSGFAVWWIPYTYIWSILWAVIMILPKNISKKKAYIVYPAISFLHGILFGTLYSPIQGLMYGLTFKQTIAWIIAGLPWDFMHGMGNLVFGFLIVPLIDLLNKLLKQKSNLN